jgi:hypothetical protein
MAKCPSGGYNLCPAGWYRQAAHISLTNPPRSVSAIPLALVFQYHPLVQIQTNHLRSLPGQHKRQAPGTGSQIQNALALKRGYVLQGRQQIPVHIFRHYHLMVGIGVIQINFDKVVHFVTLVR